MFEFNIATYVCSTKSAIETPGVTLWIEKSVKLEDNTRSVSKYGLVNL